MLGRPRPGSPACRRSERRARTIHSASRSISSSHERSARRRRSRRIELATEDFTGLIGDCAPGFSCAYMNTLSWQSHDDAAADGDQPARGVRAPVWRRRDSREAAGADEDRPQPARFRGARISRTCRPASARATVRASTQYLITFARSSGAFSAPSSRPRSLLTVPNAPVGVPESFEEHATLLFDLLALAYQADLTRVFTFMLGREFSQRTYPTSASPSRTTRSRTTATGRGDRGAREGQHVSSTLFAKFLERLQPTPDGDGSLLDHSLILYGSGMGNGNVHSADLLPTLLVGGAAGSSKATAHRWRNVDTERRSPHQHGRDVRRRARALRRQQGPHPALTTNATDPRRADRCSRRLCHLCSARRPTDAG